MNESFPNQKHTLETIPEDTASEVHKCLNALASGTATNNEIDWLIDTVEPKTIKDLVRLNNHLSESAVLEEIIKKKSLPPNFFD